METLTESEAEYLYDAYLNEIGLNGFNLPNPCKVLREIDPIQYDCGFADFCDAKGITVED